MVRKVDRFKLMIQDGHIWGHERPCQKAGLKGPKVVTGPPQRSVNLRPKGVMQ